MMNRDEVERIAGRMSSGAFWCEGCGKIGEPDNAHEPRGPYWHEDYGGDPAEPEQVQCGPMHLLAVVTVAELQELTGLVLTKVYPSSGGIF